LGGLATEATRDQIGRLAAVLCGEARLDGLIPLVDERQELYVEERLRCIFFQRFYPYRAPTRPSFIRPPLFCNRLAGIIGGRLGFLPETACTEAPTI